MVAWKAPLAGALVWLLVAGAAAAQTEAYQVLDGVTYYMAYGAIGSGSMASGPAYDGAGLAPFDGCVFAMLRPGFDHGRVRVLASVDDRTHMEIDLGDFYGAATAMQGGIAVNLTTDGSLDHAAPQHPAVFAPAAAWGAARMSVEGSPIPDPVSGAETVDAGFLVTKDGFRADDSKGMPRSDGQGWVDAATAFSAKTDKGDWEIHLRLESPPDASPSSDGFAFAPPSAYPAAVPDIGLPPNSEYSEFFQFNNTRFGGKATAHIVATAPVPPTLNELTFTIRSPTGIEVGNATLAPSVIGDAVQDLVFPLSQFGVYQVLVHGKVALAKYNIEVTLEPAADFDLNLWWENVTFGGQARQDFGDCARQLGSASGSIPAGTSVRRNEPPNFLLEIVIVGVVAAVAAVLLVVKLVSDSVSSSAFRRQYRK